MILTPVAVLIFRYNNPDAILTLLLVGAPGRRSAAIESGRLRWIVLDRDPRRLRLQHEVPAGLPRRARLRPDLADRGAGLAPAPDRAACSWPRVSLLIASGWWVVVVELIPAAARPFIGGSTNNSAIDLLLGYDGLARIFGGGGGRRRRAAVVAAAASAARPASCACSTPSSAAASAG